MFPSNSKKKSEKFDKRDYSTLSKIFEELNSQQHCRVEKFYEFKSAVRELTELF